MNKSAILCVAGGLIATPALAQSFADEFKSQVIDGTTVTGHARLYDYRRWHGDNEPYPNEDPNNSHNSRGTALGGDLIIKSGSMNGFSGGLSVYTQHSLIDYAIQNPALDPQGNVSQLAEAYLRHQSSFTQITAGRQLMNTPFANSDMYTMLTRSFRGISGAFDFGTASIVGKKSDKKAMNDPFSFSVLAPFEYDAQSGQPDIKLYIARMNRYENRHSNHFTEENRYSAGINEVDPTVPINTPGLFTAGLQYTPGFGAGDVLARLWVYNFFDYANLQFFETGYQSQKIIGGAKPYIRFQYTHQSQSGASFAGNVDATYYGAKLGVRFANADIALIVENAPKHDGSFRNGGLLHPYSDLSGVFYDDTLTNGLENLGPGRAFGLHLEYTPSKTLTLTTKYVHYLAYYGANGSLYAYHGPALFSAKGLDNGRLLPYQSSYAWDVGGTFQLSAIAASLKGFSVSDDLGIRGGFGGLKTFIVNRFRLVYSF